MRYFKNGSDVYGYDNLESTQLPLIVLAIENGWQEITGHWPPDSTLDDLIPIYELKLQQVLDSQAQAWGYDNIVSAASYVPSSNAQFKAEASALVGWRDSVWVWAAEVLSNIKTGKVSPPNSFEELIVEMPKLSARPVAR